MKGLRIYAKKILDLACNNNEPKRAALVTYIS